MSADFSLLLDADYRGLLARCFSKPQSVSALARLSGAKPNTVFRRVQKLVAAGILTAVSEQRRAGKAIKLYAPAQQTFDIPFRLTPFPSVADYMAERLSQTLRVNLEKAYERLDLQEQQLVLRVYFHSGVLQVDPVLGHNTVTQTYQHVFSPASTLTRWVPLHLAPAELQQLRGELDALTARYYRPFQEQDRQTAALGLFLLPN